MQETIVPGVASWSQWQPDRAMYFNSWLIRGEAGTFVVDPLEPDAAVLAACRAAGVRDVVITNRDHERAAETFVRELGAHVHAPAADAGALARPPDAVFHDGDAIFGWTVLTFDGCKTAGESALTRRFPGGMRVHIVGDALWGVPAGAVRMMPDEKLRDPRAAALSLRRLRAYKPDHLLLGDGTPVYGGAYAALNALFAARTDVLAQRVNVDELAYTAFPADPAPFNGSYADAGQLLGAERLGYSVAVLRPGEAFCPLHWHTREEEFFVVLRGTPTLRTPAGMFPLRPHDIIAFRCEPAGAHRLDNGAAEDAVVLMVANSDGGDVCYYPDSRKFVVEATGTLVRETPQLDYFDGEA